MYVGGCSVLCRQRIDLLKQYDVLKFDVSMNDSAIVAVVKCRCKLQHDLCDLSFWHLPVLEPLPVIVKLASSQKLHHDDELLFFRSGHHI